MLGCSPEPPHPPGASADTAAPDPGAVLWTPEAVEAAIAAQLTDHLLPNAADLTALFRDLTRQGDDACPGTDLAFATPSSSCTASTGWEYYGYAPWVDALEGDPGEQRHRADIAQASFVITAPDGRTFSAGGGFSHVQSVEGADALAWEQELKGTWLWTGEGATWLTDGVEVGWALSGERAATYHTLQLTGPLSVGDVWLYIDQISWDSAVCDGIPEVQLQLRDAAGHWYQWTAGADCSPCGPLVVGADTLGEICVDLSDTLAALDAADDLPEVGR